MTKTQVTIQQHKPDVERLLKAANHLQQFGSPSNVPDWLWNEWQDLTTPNRMSRTLHTLQTYVENERVLKQHVADLTFATKSLMFWVIGAFAIGCTLTFLIFYADTYNVSQQLRDCERKGVQCEVSVRPMYYGVTK